MELTPDKAWAGVRGVVRQYRSVYELCVGSQAEEFVPLAENLEEHASLVADRESYYLGLIEACGFFISGSINPMLMMLTGRMQIESQDVFTDGLTLACMVVYNNGGIDAEGSGEAGGVGRTEGRDEDRASASEGK